MLSTSIPMITVSELGPLPDLVLACSGKRGLRRLMDDTGIPMAVINKPDARIPLEAMVQLFDAAAREVGDESFGLSVGRGNELSDFGDWVAYSVGAPNLGKGLTRLCDTIWVHDTGTRMWLSLRGDHVLWHCTSGLALSCSVRAYSDHLFKPMLDFLRAFLGESWEPEWLELDYPKPQDRGAYASLIDGPLIFDRPQIGIPVRRTNLRETSKVANLLPRPVTSLDLRKYRTQRTKDPVEQFIDLIDLGFPNGKPTLDGIARLLGVGPRTLQRTLSRQGTQFRTLLEIARRRRAEVLLRETGLPIKAIAGDLGYGEAENFTRAFRSWFGVGPTAFRAADVCNLPLRARD